MDKTILSRATTTEDTPTPGYLYGEIAKMTQHGYDTCTKVEEFLINRLKKKNPNTKYKALQVIKHTCREGRMDFRKNMQKHIPIIKECLQFRGPPDPLKGDEYYRRVREAAKDCLDAIYDTSTTPGLSNLGISNRIRGVGNTYVEQPPQQTNTSTGWTNKIGWGASNNTALSNINGPQYPIMDSNKYDYGNKAYNTDPNRIQQCEMYQYASPGYKAPDIPGGTQGQVPSPYNTSNDNTYNNEQFQYGYNPRYSEDSSSYGGPTYTNNYPIPPPNEYNRGRISGMGNPLYETNTEQSKGFLAGLKEKAASKFKSETRPPVNFAGPPPGSSNPPDGWSFATNRGPTGGQFMSTYNNAYNPGRYNAPGNAAVNNAWGPPAIAQQTYDPSTKLKEKAYEGPRKKGMVGGVWAAPTTPPSEDQVNNLTLNNQYAGQQRSELLGQTSYEQSYNNTNITQGYRRTSYTQEQDTQQGQITRVGQTQGALSDGSYERNLLTSLCAPGGMRAVPPKDKLENFLKSSTTLNVDIVGPILEDLLDDNAWQVVSKALCIIEELLRTPGNEAGYTEYFIENCTCIEECTRHEKLSVRDRATKILCILGVTGIQDIKTDTENRQEGNPNTTTDLLGDLSPRKDQKQIGRQVQEALEGNVPNNKNIFEGLAIPSANTSDTGTSSNVGTSIKEHDVPVSNVTDIFGGLQLQPNSQVYQQSSHNLLHQYDNKHTSPSLNNYAQGQSLPLHTSAQQHYVQNMQQQQQQINYMTSPISGNYALTPGSRGSINAINNTMMYGSGMMPTYITKTIDDPDNIQSDTGSGSTNIGQRNLKTSAHDTNSSTFNFIQDALKNG